MIKWRYSDYLEPFVAQVAQKFNVTEEEAYERVCLLDEEMVFDQKSSDMTNYACKLFGAEKYSVIEHKSGKWSVVHVKAFTQVGGSLLMRDVKKSWFTGNKFECDNWLKEGEIWKS